MKLELGIEISHETIDGYIWADKKSGGRIYKFLRTKGKKYRSRGVSIDDRPKIVDEKSRIGDWEIDTLIGKNHKQAWVAIVERKSKFSLMRIRREQDGRTGGYRHNRTVAPRRGSCADPHRRPRKGVCLP